ncbi:MAG: hypothetical protein ACI977_000518 [Candidatus Nanohaloarchaea archaeon]|jgi:hypothetical protein
MELKTTREDVILITGLIAAAVLNGVIWNVMNFGVGAEAWFRFVEGAAVLTAFYGIYRSRGLWGGEVARSLEVTSLGIIVYLLTYIPHIGWHVSGNSASLGIPSGVWVGFFHGISAVSFLIVGYGLYLFSESSKQL